MEDKNTKMLQLNKYAREYIESYDDKIDYQRIAEQMKDFSGAEYVMFNIFDENGKDFTLVGFEGNKKNIEKAMNIIGYNIIGKKFEYEKGRNEKFEKSIVTKVESLKALVGKALPGAAVSIIEKIFKIDSILTVRISKDEKTIGNFTLIFSENQNKNDNEMLKLFASQVGLFLDKKKSEEKTLEAIQRFKSLLKNSVNLIHIFDNKGNYIDVSDATANLLGKEKEDIIGKSFKDILPERVTEDFMKTILTINKTKTHIHKKDILNLDNEERVYESIIFPIEEKNNEVVLFGSIANDITEKVKHQEKIRDERDYIYKIFNSMSQYVIVTGLDYKIQFMNKKAIKEFGDMKGKVCFEQLGREIPCEGCRLHEIEKIKDNESIKYTIKAHNKDLEINASRIENLDGSFSIVEVIEDITEKKKSKQKIIEMNERLENIIKGTNVGTWEWNLETGETIFDNKWAEMLGYTLEEISPVNIQTWEKLTHPDDFKRAGKELEKVMNKELEYYDFELRMKHKNGEWIWIHDRGRVTKWSDDGKALFISGTHMDISDRKKIEERLKENQIRLELAMDAGEHGFWDWNLTTDITYFSPTYYTMLGYEDKELPMNFDTFNQLIHPDDATKVMHKIKQRISAGKAYEAEFRLKCKDGSYRWILGKGKTYFNDETGKPNRAVGVHIDINERKEMEQQLKESQLRLEIATEGTETGVWDWDMVNDSVTYSTQWKKMLGYEDHEVENTFSGWKNLWHPDDSTSIEKALKDHLAGKTEKYEIVHRLRHKNGDWRWIVTRGTILKDSNNKPYRKIGTNVDITKIKQIEARLFQEKEEFKTTLISVGDGVISTDEKGRIKLMNDVAEKLTGWTQEEAYNKPLEKVLNIINEYSREICENPAKKALELGKIVEMANHTILIAKDNKEIPIEDSAAPIKDRNGNITGTVIVFRDFTEKREKQKEIEYLSFNDHLTGLYNRRYMEDSINRMDTERNLPFSIIAADVNGLKLTNDAYGHEMGDKLLIAVAEIFKKSCRHEDIVCRVGGDEFVILLPNVDEKKVEKIIERIKEESQNTTLDSVIVSLALGYSTKKRKDKDILEVYKEADNKMYKNKLKYGKIMRNKTIETVLLNINNKYDHEQIHSERVSQYSMGIAKAMNLTTKETEDAKIAGLLHDIGKVIIPSEILNKKGKLNKKEWEEVKKHSSTSYQLLKSVDEYTHVAEAVLHHHERLDGSGYPEGLKDSEIPLLSKIIAVADAYEAMTANRPYQKKKIKEKAVEELKKYSGLQFDKYIVEIFTNKVL